MALSQMYAVSGRKMDPNYTAIINSQTPYLLGMKRQQAEDDLAKRSLALKEQELIQNEQLAREEMEQNQKQTKKANLLGVANLGLRGGLAAYENVPEVKNVVDKAVGGIKGLFTESPTPSGASSYLGDAFEAGSASDWMQSLGDWGEFAQPVAEKVASGAAEYLGDAFSGFADAGGDVYGSAIESALDFSDFDWSSWDLF